LKTLSLALAMHPMIADTAYDCLKSLVFRRLGQLLDYTRGLAPA
jgi:hypothetical protein